MGLAECWSRTVMLVRHELDSLPQHIPAITVSFVNLLQWQRGRYGESFSPFRETGGKAAWCDSCSDEVWLSSFDEVVPCSPEPLLRWLSSARLSPKRWRSDAVLSEQQMMLKKWLDWNHHTRARMGSLSLSRHTTQTHAREGDTEKHRARDDDERNAYEEKNEIFMQEKGTALQFCHLLLLLLSIAYYHCRFLCNPPPLPLVGTIDLECLKPTSCPAYQKHTR